MAQNEINTENNPKVRWFIHHRAGRWLLFLVAILLATGLWLPRNWSFYGPNDWDLTYSMFEVARKSIVDYGQFPQFNPWMAFGSDLNANPQSGHISIFFMPILLFGTFYGYKLSIVLAMFIGMTGAYQWFLKVGQSRTNAVSASLIFSLAAYFSSHVFTAGHSNTLYLYFTPWLAWLVLNLKEKYRPGYFIAAILILAQVIIGGAPMAYIMLAAMLGLWAIGDIWMQHSWGLFKISAALLFGSTLLSIWKILPAIALWSDTPRLVKDESGISLFQWIESLGGIAFRTGTWHAHYEYLLGFPLILVGLLLYFRKNIPHFAKWFVLFGALVWICLGNSPDYLNPWYWLNHYVPPFNGIRAPSRFGIVAVFALITAMVYVVNKTTHGQILKVVLFTAAVAQLLSFKAASSFMEDTPQLTPEKLSGIHANPIPSNHIISEPEKTSFLHIRQNHLIPNAYEPLNLTEVKDSTAVISKGADIIRFSPNFIAIKSDSDTVVVGLRYSSCWHLFGAGSLEEKNGVIQITGAKGERIISYHNPLVFKGLWMSLLALPFMMMSHLLLKRKQ